jgi:PAS domain S-box-containing protein
LETISILVVEDNPGDARLIKEYLKADTSVSYSIYITTTLAESLKTLSNKKFDVVLVDLGLPDSQGIYTFQEIIHSNPRSPIIIITGNNDEDLGLEAIKNGAQNYMVKNQINSTLLIRTIKYAIEIKRKNIELKEGQQKYRSIFEGAASLILSVNPSGDIIDCNNRIQQLLGYSKDEVIGKPIKKIIHPDSYEKAKKSMGEVFENGILCAGEYKMTRKDGKAIFVNIHSSVLKDEDKKSVTVSCIIDDITQRILYEKKQLLTTRILTILNRHNEWHNLLYDILIEIGKFSGIQAIGIRHKEDEDYPYFDAIGFPDSFIKKENFLCARNKKGELIYDCDGKTVLECMCGNIISKKTDSSLSFFTKAGSFWTNSTTNLLNTTTDKERQTHTRNHCNAAGYESVALIPLNSENETIGLLQLNDKRKNMFTEEMIHLFEDIGLTLGIAFKRIKTEKLISDSEEKFSIAFQTSPYAITITRASDGRFIDVNNTFTSITGFTRKEALADSSVGLRIWADIKDRKNVVTALTEGKEVISYEFQFRKKNGKILTGLFSAHFITLNNEQFILSSINDITKRKISEEALTHEQYLMNTLMNNVPENIFFKDRAGRFIRISKAQAKFFGLKDPSEAEGKTDFDFFTEEHARQAYNDEQEIIRTEQPISKEEKETWADHPDTWVLTTKLPLHDKAGNIIGTFGISMDITERKQAEMLLHEKKQRIEAQNEELLQTNEKLKHAKEKAEESDRLKTAFLHNISHEIRTPLNGIIGFSKIITDPDLTTEKREQFSQIISDSSNQLLSIINDIINIASIEAGHVITNEIESDINGLLKAIKSQNAAMIAAKNLLFTVSSALTDDEAIIFVDEIKLLHILTNLISNAIKFTLKGYIKIDCRLNGKFVKFTVEDTGIGIPAKMHEKIFDRFFQIDSSETRLYGGTGLGLSIVKSYVQFLKGEIHLDSKPGEGTVFIISIPYKPVKQFKHANISVHANYKQIVPTSILIVEDEIANYKLLNEYLSDLHLTIIYVTNGLQAVEACRKNPSISLVLMDVKMPLMDGYEAARQIKEFRPQLPIIIQTAYIFQNEREKSMSVYVDGFIEKPINKSILLETLHKKL